jgi:hypothetical protein
MPARSRKYKRVIVDEAAFAPELKDQWANCIRPSLSDLKGDAWFFSTPNGLNEFHQMHLRGLDPEREDWASWSMPTSGNPFIDPDEIEAARRDLSELAFRQEYLAQFIQWEGAVFRSIGSAIWEPPEDLKGFKRPGIFDSWAPTFAIGVDWGRTNDRTVFTVACSLPPTENIIVNGLTGKIENPEDIFEHAGIVEVQAFRGVPYAIQRARLMALAARYGWPVTLCESNSIGGPVLEQLQSDGMLNLRGFTTTNATKAQIIERLGLAFERGLINIPNDPELIGELQAFEATKLPSGLVRYAAPDGGHDDHVISLALAYYALQRFAGWTSADPRMIEAQREFAVKVLTGGFSGARF